VSVEADILRIKADASANLGFARRRGFESLRQPRQGEFGAERPAPAAAHEASDVADLFFEHEPHILRRQRIGSSDMGEQRRRPDRRMPGERQFARRGEDPDAGHVGGVLRLEDEDCLGQIEFARDRLHATVIETFGVQHDRERIAGERGLGEDVKREETARHRREPPFPDRGPSIRASLRGAAVRHGEIVRQAILAAQADIRMVDFRHVLRRGERVQRVAVVLARVRAWPGGQVGWSWVDHDHMSGGGRMARMTVNRLGACGAGRYKRRSESGDPQHLDCTHGQPLPFRIDYATRIDKFCDDMKKK
jgi:hypothetical protein